MNKINGPPISLARLTHKASNIIRSERPTERAAKERKRDAAEGSA